MKKIQEEYHNIYEILEFQKKGIKLFTYFYVDGKLFLQKVIDKNKPKDGIQKITRLDPMKIKKVTVTPPPNSEGVYDLTKIKSYYAYSDTLDVHNIAKISKCLIINNDAIAYTDSGLYDQETGMALSYLWKTIIPYNNMKLMQDSLIVYRVVRSPERRVFYISVGNLSKTKAEQYIKELMNRFRNKLVYDQKTGSISDRKNVLSMVEDYWLPRRDDGKGTEITTLPGGCFALDTKIPLLDSRTLNILEIEKELSEGKELWAYSCNPQTGSIEPGLITWAGTTRINTQVMKITLDNGESVTCTPDHKFPLPDGVKVEAKDLIIGQSMIPLYREKKFISKNKKLDYEKIFDNEEKKWKFTHRMVRDWLKDNEILESYIFEIDKSDKNVCHHKDYNRHNNSPRNLVMMSWKDHSLLHSHLGFRINKEAQMLGTAASKEKRKNDQVFANRMREIARENIKKAHTREIWDKVTKSSKIIEHRYSSKNKKHLEKFGHLGCAVLQERLKDTGFNIWFREQIKKGWTEEKPGAAHDAAA